MTEEPETDPLLYLLGHPLPALIESPCTTTATTISTGTGTSRIDRHGSGVDDEDDDDGEGKGRRTIDLFLLSLQKPILLFLLPGLTTATATATMSRRDGGVEAEEMVGRRAGEGNGVPASSSSAAVSQPSSGPGSCIAPLLSIQHHLSELKQLEILTTGEELQVFVMSSQCIDELEEVRERLGLKFHLLSDSTLAFTRALDLPTLPSLSSSPSSSTHPTSNSPSAPPSRPLLQPLTLLLREGQIVRKDCVTVEGQSTMGSRARELLKPPMQER